MMLRISALAIAVIAAIGLWKKAWLPEKKCFRAGFFVYYTHLSNLFILVYELVLGASGHDPDGGVYRWLSSPGVAVSVTLCIYVTPGLVVLQWLLWQDKTGLTVGHAAWWLVLPLAYFAFAMLRARTGVPIGHSDKLYPYPFLDYPRLGAKRFWLYVIGILAFFFALGCLFVGIGGWLT